MNVREAAARAERLQRNEDFVSIIKEFREDAHVAFANSGVLETGTREEAHAQLRMIQKLEGTLEAAVAARTLLDKKEAQNG